LLKLSQTLKDPLAEKFEKDIRANKKRSKYYAQKGT
jgi:hypothetical protein